MEEIDVILEIEKDNNPIIDGLDYYMDCIVTVNGVRTMADQVSIVKCDMADFPNEHSRTGIQFLLEIRNGDKISWIFIDEIESLKVEEYFKE